MAVFGFGKDKQQTKKHSIIEVIRSDLDPDPMPNDVLIWKFGNNDFNTNTQLIVGPSQEAIFVKGGQVLGNFTSGTYTLNTKNYPFIRSLTSMATGGVSPFSCSVYYVNKVISMGIDWGTDSPIRIIDPHYGVPVDLTGYGDFSIQVENGQKLFTKLVGETHRYSHAEIKRYFSNLMANHVRSVITSIIVEKRMSLYGIDSKLLELSLAAQEQVATIFEPYGLAVNHFAIARISYSGLEEIEAQIAEEARTNIAFSQETHRHRVSTDIEVEDTIKTGHATAEANRTLGFSAKEQAIAQMGSTLAGNPGPWTGGTGVPFPGLIGSNIIQPATAGTADIARILLNQQDRQTHPPMPDYSTASTKQDVPDMEGLEEASVKSMSKSEQGSFEERAKKLKFLLDNDMITHDQFQDKLNQLMSEI